MMPSTATAEPATAEPTKVRRGTGPVTVEPTADQVLTEAAAQRRHAGYTPPREISRARRTYLAVWTLIAMLAGLVLVVAGFIAHEDTPTALLPLVLCTVGGAFETAVFATYLAEARR